LAESVQADGWPTLRASRGKILFAFDNTDAHRDDYLRGNPSLEGRTLFVSSRPDQPSAAFIKMNETLDASQGEGENTIREQARHGFLIQRVLTFPPPRRKTAARAPRRGLRSGAHYVSTDYPEASPFGSRYIARLPGAEHLPA
jgi:hypothetical protein